MTTLQIEHAIVDFTTWRAAFDRFASARENAGVRGHRIQRPVDDEHYVVVDLEFEARDGAAEFLHFLRETVWASPENSPALVGAPSARILETCD